MSATSETLVGLLVLMPAFWAVDYLGRLADVDRATLMSARHAAWEETATRPDPHLVRERLYGNDHTGLLSSRELKDSGPSINPLHAGGRRPLMADRWTPSLRHRAPGSASAPPGTGPGTAAIAHGRRVPAVVRIGGLSGQMLDLPDAPLRVHEVRAEIAADARMSSATERSDRLIFSASHGVLHRDWQARSDRDYQRRTEAVVASEPVSLLTRPAPTLGRLTVFKEGRHAKSTDFIPPSRVVPR